MCPDNIQLSVTSTGLLDLPDDEAALVTAELVYNSDDCLAVNLTLMGPEGAEVSWCFAWTLLARGLVAPTGEGDIHVRPLPGRVPGVEVVFASLSSACIRFPAKDVGYFVSKVREKARADESRIGRTLDAELLSIMEQP